MTDVTVVGTGAMGFPIAKNLLAAGFDVAVWNRDVTRLAPLVDLGATPVADLDRIFSGGVVLSVLADDVSVREVFLDSDALTSADEGAVHVNLATISPALACEAEATHAARGVGYLAAPMFGGVPVAEAGDLNIVAAGDAASLELARPFLDAISARVWSLGDRPRLANVAKVAGQVMIASAIQTLSEAVSLGEREGIDAAALVDLFTSTITPGPVYTNYGRLVAAERYSPAGFTTVLGLKDVELARAHAASAGLRLPVGDLLSELLGEVVDAGGGLDDWASLAAAQRRRAAREDI